MKVTAIIPDLLISEVRKLSKGKNITESLIIALQDWISIQKLNNLSRQIRSSPLKFQDAFSAENIRNLNRS